MRASKQSVVQLSKIRVPEEIHSKLKEEAADQETTLNAVIVDRLRRSYIETDALGGPTLHSCFLAMADIAKSQSAHHGVGFLEDRKLFDFVLREWMILMRRLFRPPARSNVAEPAVEPPADADAA
jgi:hypothetical protein